MSSTSVRPAVLLLGSHRQNGNAAGLASWVTSTWNTQSSARGDKMTPFESSQDLAASLSVQGPVTGAVMPIMITKTEDYEDPDIRRWSARIRDSSVVVVLTPEYNGSFPGPLKNAIDQLYFEWKDKPVLIISYGGRGGVKAAQGLRNVFNHGVNAQVIAEINITLPSDYIERLDLRVAVGTPPEFLKTFESDLVTVINVALDSVAAEHATNKAA